MLVYLVGLWGQYWVHRFISVVEEVGPFWLSKRLVHTGHCSQAFEPMFIPAMGVRMTDHRPNEIGSDPALALSCWSLFSTPSHLPLCYSPFCCPMFSLSFCFSNPFTCIFSKSSTAGINSQIQEAWKASSAPQNVWAHKMQTKENQFSLWNMQVGKTRSWTVTAWHFTLLTTSLEKRTIPRDTRQHPWYPSKGPSNRSRKESGDLWLYRASLPTRTLDTYKHRWLSRRGCQEWSGGIYISLHNGTVIQQAMPMGKFFINYKAEADALQT